MSQELHKYGFWDYEDSIKEIVHSKNHMKIKEKHMVNLCANHWVVQPISLSKIFGNVNTKLEDDKGEFTYSGYVMSELWIIM